jgi:hypothetical protein
MVLGWQLCEALVNSGSMVERGQDSTSQAGCHEDQLPDQLQSALLGRQTVPAFARGIEDVARWASRVVGGAPKNLAPRCNARGSRDTP